MNTKEAINYVESKRYTMDYCNNNKLADEVIKCLEEGEKYKKMWGEVEEDSCEFELIKNIKQKYFPKPKNRWHRINNMIYNLNTIGDKFEIKELTSLLIELRDEESD